MSLHGTRAAVLLTVVLGLSCARSAPSESEAQNLSSPAPMEAPPPPAAARARADDALNRAESRQMEMGMGAAKMAPRAPAFGDGATDPEPAPAEPPAERTRSWFPEAFLWQPLVATGPDGTATVPFTVPDSLTEWRVLGLAHDEGGQQTGTVTTFSSSLPIYVDPVVPGWLHAGDRILLPVQVMNNTKDAIDGVVSLEATGPLEGAGTASITLSAGASDVRSLPLLVTGAGEAHLTARFRSAAGADAAERVIPVRPTGRPVVGTSGGTLTDRREVVLAAAPGADPATQQVEVVLFGGPLAVLQAELERLAGGARPVDAAYGFALSGSAESLATAAGVPIPPETLRRVRLLAWQRVVREARAADAGVASDLFASLQGELGVEAAGPVRTGLLRAVVDGQRADGTWGRRAEASLQEILVTTALTARSLPTDQHAPRMRASAALERFLHEVKDPYTAACLAASGLFDDDTAGRLRTQVTEAIVRGPDGTPHLPVPDGVLNPRGARPSPAEATTVAVLALLDGPERRDLAATLLAGWNASAGFGAGKADVLALEAVVSTLPPTTSASVVTMLADGAVVATGRFDPTRPGDLVLLQARPPEGAAITLSAEPPVGGVAFVATRRSWLPWTDADRQPGVDVAVSSASLAVGQSGSVAMELLAPAGRTVTVELPLPAGMSVDLDTLVAANPGLGRSRVSVATDRVVLTSSPFAPATLQRFSLPVTPAFGGRFTTEPVLVSVDGGSAVAVRPPVYVVEGAPGS